MRANISLALLWCLIFSPLLGLSHVHGESHCDHHVEKEFEEHGLCVSAKAKSDCPLCNILSQRLHVTLLSALEDWVQSSGLAQPCLGTEVIVAKLALHGAYGARAPPPYISHS